MTVARDFGKVVFHCDGRPGGKRCHEYLETDCKFFPDAVVVLKENDWLVTKEDGGDWHHFCPECVGDEYKT